MKERPILFSTPMVQAVLENRKSQTRRMKGLEIINQNPNDWQFEWMDYSCKCPFRFTQISTINEKSLKDKTFHQEALKCPYGEPGDILWVRETFLNNALESYPPFYFYKADGEEKPSDRKWRPSIHMPKDASRISLNITNIRVQRLQKISDSDAINEGIPDYPDFKGDCPVDDFKELWQKINGEKSWTENPWVWVISFENAKRK